MDLSGALSWLKLSPRYLFAISIATGIVLFSPDEFIESLGMTSIKETFKPYIGFAFILTLALLLAYCVFESFNWIKTKIVRKKNLAKYQQYLHQLTPEEVSILRGYIGGRTRTQKLSIESGVVQGLVSNKVIYQSASVGDLLEGWAYNIQPWAWDYLNENLQLLFTPDEMEDVDPRPY